MTQLTLVKKAFTPTQTGYALDLEVTSDNNTSTYVFVKQRIHNILTSKFDDVFAAVATPAQLEELSLNAPDSSTSYFLDNKVSIIGTTASYMEQVFQDISAEIARLVNDLEAIKNLNSTTTYTFLAGTAQEIADYNASH